MKNLNSKEYFEKLARYASQDEANRNMRKNGRTAWNEDDYNIAVNKFNSLVKEGRTDEN